MEVTLHELFIFFDGVDSLTGLKSINQCDYFLIVLIFFCTKHPLWLLGIVNVFNDGFVAQKIKHAALE